MTIFYRIAYYSIACFVLYCIVVQRTFVYFDSLFIYLFIYLLIFGLLATSSIKLNLNLIRWTWHHTQKPTKSDIWEAIRIVKLVYLSRPIIGNLVVDYV